MKDPSGTPPDRMGWGWRIGFSLAALVVVVLPLASLVAGVLSPRAGWCGLPFVAVAVLSVVHHWGLELRWQWHLRKHGSREGFRYVSGIPVLGNLFALLGALFGWGDWWVAVPAVLAVALDPGGLPYFVVQMIRTRQF